ncbi:hypothetical protein [Gordonia shandongensis]|uniref:hypothetical protein n=1 Tax=Gordonia shandongensis TaxID=376351 RepID=UPI0004264089|nr:hypothetical protein [Gordonia shandongensis]
MSRTRTIAATVLTGAAVATAVGAGTAQASTHYLPPTTRFNVLLGDQPTLTEVLAVTPDGHGRLAMRATRSSSGTFHYPIQVFRINFATGQSGYVSAPYESDAVVTTGRGTVGIGNFVGFPASPSLGAVTS